jgi:peptidoglycan/LPS O-acetylase OafA/YrhL
MHSLFRIPQSRAGISTHLSDYLDLIRFGAAVVVLFFHIRTDLFGPWLWQIRGYGHTAVTAFFVLSGFVIAHTCASGKHGDLRDYAISRLARLYSVIIPAIALTIVADAVCSHFYHSFYQAYLLSDDVPNADSPINFLVGATFTNELWFAHVPLGSNDPYWSLSYEFWYYVLFGLAVFLRGRLRIWLCAIAALIIGPKILLYFPIWLFGVAAYILQARAGHHRAIGWAIALASIAALVAVQLSGLHRWDSFDQASLFWPVKFNWYDFLAGALFALNILGAAIALNRPAATGSRLHGPIKYVAGGTFSVYLYHKPLLLLLSAFAAGKVFHPSAGLSLLLYLCLFGAVFALAEITERQKHRWKNWIQRMIPAHG